MVNVFFELYRLRAYLISKDIDSDTIERIISKANSEITTLVEQRGNQALEKAVQIGAQKESAEFINELRLDTINFEVSTESGSLDFSTPPRPMLPFLLNNAKPIKDGSGVYKVIPVGGPSTKPPFSINIIDAQRKISAERIEVAKAQARTIAPSGSKIFRTATSKQDATKQWVQPAKEKDFTADMKEVNQELQASLDDSIYEIINNYMELY